ncbi:metal ABC transporter solute-binding protein, Zn/Mn family [Paenibacillus thailandensis]|uniref:Metal ABC transporter solute-binding protein, Zn/Mn family n=1 Tax=Paenibacillus thailandensis TaxID=393250 RepID=A0ABW5QYQ8_9BACL
MTVTNGMTIRRAAGFAAAVALILVLAACGGGAGSKLAEGKTNVVTSFYPLYYFASEIGGDEVNVVNLVPAGVEPHDWTPKSQDIETASNADLFLYNGAGFESWADNFLQGISKDSTVKTAVISDGIELLEGEGEEHEEHGEEHEEHGEEEGHEHDSHVDPHTWVSPKSALIMAENVKNALVEADAAHKDVYEANYADLKQRLEELDARYETELAGVTRKDIVVSHQAFSYLARDYGLNQVAIMGLSPDAEPRAQDLMNVVKFVKDNDVQYIFFEELVSDQLAKTLADEAGVETLVLNPVEGLTQEQEKEGKDFISIMNENLDHLLQALK